MAKTTGSGKGSNSSTSNDLYSGLKNRSPKPPDGKITRSSGSVNDDATRSSTAKTPPTLGPRTA